MLLGMELFSYVEKQSRLDLFSLEWRKLRGNLIEVYKIMWGILWGNTRELFPIAEEFEIGE